MKRVLRKTSQPIAIIELSDSEDEAANVSSDDNYVPEKKVAKTSQRKKKTESSGNDANANNKKRKARTSVSPVKRTRKIAKPKIETVKTGDVTNINIKESIDFKTEVTKKTKKEEVETSDEENLKERLKDKMRLQSNSIECKEWTDVEFISEINNVSRHIAENVIELFKADNTIPFIARYRKNMTEGMEPDELRALKETFDHAKTIKHRAATILKVIDKSGQWTPNLHSIITSSKSLEDLDHIYSFYKPASKRSLAARAIELGLGPISNAVLQGQPLPHISTLIDSEKEGLKTEEQIKEGIMHIIADTINKDKAVFDKVKELQDTCSIQIQTVECKTNKSNSKEKDVNRKYETYYDFNTTTRNIKPHQILAINRGEAQKILNVKIIVPDFLQRAFKTQCCKQYKEARTATQFHKIVMNDSIDCAYTKFIKPLIVRRVRNEMKQKAETASIEVFVTNVKQLLLTPPVRGKIILGIDPGFSHGCKLAVISEHGNVLETAVIYPHKKWKTAIEESENTVIKLVTKHKCTILALGNATACRETESFLNRLIKSKAFGSMDIFYAIVDEAGASIYSCSPEAKSEFPDLDINLVSAVSIARRLQDPLAELVKVEPKHLGVGMYQHDLPEKQLSEALNEVVSEAVSFVGVDVNTASQCLMRRVAGLNATRANNIINWRTEFGPFKNRQQLLDVKGIGNKTFEQCAGFIRILPETSMTDNLVKAAGAKNSKKHTPNLLDQTWIHPESYELAMQFVEFCGCKLENLGTTAFIENVKSCARRGCDVLAEKFHTDATTMAIIVQGLSMKKDEDIRLKTNYPLFRNSMLSIKDISNGTSLTGAVRNVTHFGAFVDVGVGRDGLIPKQWMKNCTLSIGQRVEVKVQTVDINRNRISLELIQTL
ncbi:PREDICTED: S1 RNA-binding domain-containing protein 1 [Dufourea novaeangliae]|uniref:S1 RNA-binding domain-containing protein 1 n=1 Tax=Dufourea novaeangliae TaxID=178035 RepID=A0A154PFV8_DUFNO|nr:PREDICTED: S1 RNA-binding domain-containing protein 1 [Dufourea novaeangliae]KZC10707.1 S1 RNA-binding domain-containing protein 1 [Dufourea novaeangliae]